MSKNEKKIDYFKWRDRKKLPVSIDIRLLESDDYDKGFIELLPILLNRDISVIRRSIGSKEKFTSRVDKMNGSFNINVIEHFGEIIATCSMILEYKRGVDTTQYLIAIAMDLIILIVNGIKKKLNFYSLEIPWSMALV